MKRTMCFISLFLAIFLLSSCADIEEGSQSSGETNLPASVPANSSLPKEMDSTVQPLDAETSSTDMESLKQTFTESDFLFKKYNPHTVVKTTISLPDSLGTARGSKEDKRNDNRYYIADLDMELEIPEGYYLYRVDGLYMDQDSNPVFLEFVDEYILALRDIAEKDLIREIYGYYEARFYNGMTQVLLKNAVPHWILWNFKVIHKDYYAVEQLYESRTPMSGEIRLSNNYLILTGTTRPWIKDEMMEGFYIDEYAPEVEAVKKELISRDKEIDWDLIGQVLDNRYEWPLRIPEGKWFTDEMIDLIQSKSSSTGLEYRYLHGIYVMGTINDRNWLFGINEYIPLWPEQDKKDTSLLSELWWQDYCEAVKALSERPEKYSVPRIQLSFSSDWDPHLGGGPNLDQRKGWEQNSLDEINVRAFVYAWLKNTGRETPLENIVIYLKKSENNLPLFLAFIMERSDNCRLIPVRKGIDLLSFCDLSVARKYVEENSNAFYGVRFFENYMYYFDKHSGV